MMNLDDSLSDELDSSDELNSINELNSIFRKLTQKKIHVYLSHILRCL